MRDPASKTVMKEGTQSQGSTHRHTHTLIHAHYGPPTHTHNGLTVKLAPFERPEGSKGGKKRKKMVRSRSLTKNLEQ